MRVPRRLPKRQRVLARLDQVAVSLAVVDRHEDDEEWPDYNCGERCDFCIPDWRERDEKLSQLDRDLPVFTIADRVLAQVGLVVRQISPCSRA